MNQKPINRNISLVYLSLIPFITALLGFAIGHSSFKIYLPAWIINVCLMVLAAWVVGLHVIRNGDADKKQLAAGAFMLIVPWILVSMFAGLGPPPETAFQWTEMATEQQVRYFMLVTAGVFIAIGFSIIKEKLNNSGEKFFSQLGITAVYLAIPLFIINMIFWGFFLTELFRIMAASSTEILPDWFLPSRKLFGFMSVVEVALTYLATVFFAISLNKAGWFGKTATRIYVVISLLAFIIIVFSAFLHEPFITAGFAVSIPAIPFIMPYFIGINLLRRAGNRSVARDCS